MMTKAMFRLILKTLSVAIVVICFRSLSLESNFSPLGAISLLLSGPGVLLGLAISDLWLGAYSYWPFVYVGFALYAWIGRVSAIEDSWKSLIGRVCLASFAFYVVSNLGFFVMSDFYSKDFKGLILCFYSAIPFALKTFAADLVFSFILMAMVKGFSKISVNKPEATL